MRLIEIDIISESSIIDVEADYLLLKNAAEGVFGPEERINNVSGGRLELYNTSEATDIGAVNFISKVEGVKAKGILLVGIGEGFRLRYETIYEMCVQAIKELAQPTVVCKVLGTIVHGAGFGLDKLELFKTQIYGFKSSIEAYEQKINLEKIVFNEIGLENANSLRTYLENLSNEEDSFIVEADNRYFIKAGGNLAEAKKFATRVKESKYIFVAMPFAAEFENTYDFGIRLPVEENQLLPIRTDKQYFTGMIIEEIKNRIRESSIVIADISTSNPNVLFELGFAQGCDKPVIIICRNGEDLPFDVSGMNVIFYNPHLIRELKSLVGAALAQLTKSMSNDIEIPK